MTKLAISIKATIDATWAALQTLRRNISACEGTEATSYGRLALPSIVRGILRNGRAEATGVHFRLVGDVLRQGESNLAACPDVKGFTEEDWMYLDRLALHQAAGT